MTITKEIMEVMRERENQMEDIMEIVSSIEGYEVEDILGSMIDSLSVELSQAIKVTEGEYALDDVFEMGSEIVDYIREEMEDDENSNIMIELAKATLASASVFQTMLKAFIDINKEVSEKYDMLTKTEEEDDSLDMSLIKNLYDKGLIDNNGLARMLERGEATLSDIQEHFGNKIASAVLEIASKTLSNSLNFNKNVVEEKSLSEDVVKKELAEFEKVKRRISEGTIKFEEFKDIVEGYSKETLDEIFKESEDKVVALSVETGVPVNVIKEVLSIFA